MVDEELGVVVFVVRRVRQWVQWNAVGEPHTLPWGLHTGLKPVWRVGLDRIGARYRIGVAPVWLRRPGFNVARLQRPGDIRRARAPHVVRLRVLQSAYVAVHDGWSGVRAIVGVCEAEEMTEFVY